MIPSAVAIQIGAPREGLSFVFEPGLEKSFTYHVRNNRQFEVYAVPKMAGRLTEYVTFNTDRILLKPGQVGEFTATLVLPQDISPGEHELRMGAGEEIPNSGGVSVQTTAQFRVLVRGRHEGAYITGDLVTTTQITGKKRFEHFSLGLRNLGDRDVEGIQVVIDVYDAQDNPVALLRPPQVSLGKDKHTTLETNMETTGFAKGDYWAEATISHIGGEFRTNKALFRIGEHLISIGDYPKEGFSGSIQQFDIDITSEWNENIENVYGRIILKNQEVLSELQTPSIVLEPFGKETLSGFIDLTTVNPGTYELELQLHYANKLTKVYDKYTVLTAVDLENPGVLSNAVLVTNILFIILIILLLGNFYKLWRKKK